MGDTLTDMDEFIFANVEEVLFRLAEDLRENYKDALLQSDRVASRKLYQSVRTQVVFGLNSWDVQMSLEDYWKYVENDTRPHWPPRDKILQWIQIKPVIPRPDARGKIPTPQQLSFLISRKIATFGTEGSHDLEKTVEGVLPWYMEELTQALQKDATAYVHNLMPWIQGSAK